MVKNITAVKRNATMKHNATVVKVPTKKSGNSTFQVKVREPKEKVISYYQR